MTAQSAVDMSGDPLVVGEGRQQLLAFFSTTCQGCLSSLPRFLAALRASDFPANAVVAVLVGPSATAEKILLEALTGVVRLVREQDMGPVATAYNVQLFPSFVKLEQGIVIGKGPSAADVLPTGQTVGSKGTSR